MNKPPSSAMQSSLNAGLFYAFGAALCFSFKPVLVKLIYQYQLESITLLTWRMLLSLPIYLVIGWLLHKRARRAGRQLERRWIIKTFLVGMVGYYLAALFDLKGLQTITAQLERLILFTYPTWVAVFSWLLLKTPLTKNILLALVISYIGIAVIFISDWQLLGDSVIIGAIWVLLSALSLALYVVLGKPLIDHIGANEFTVIAMISSSFFTLVHFLAVQPVTALLIPLPAIWLVLVMAIVSTVLPTFMLAAAISRVGPSRTAITGTLGPAMTSIFAVMLLDEFFGWPQLTGLILVVSAIAVMQLNWPGSLGKAQRAQR